MDPLQWMGAVRTRGQTADKNFTIIHVIHTTPVHQLKSCEEKICAFVRNKSIIKAFLTSDCCFWLNMSPLTIILLSSVNNHLVWIRRGICIFLSREWAKISRSLQDPFGRFRQPFRAQDEELFLHDCKLLTLSRLFWRALCSCKKEAQRLNLSGFFIHVVNQCNSSI